MVVNLVAYSRPFFIPAYIPSVTLMVATFLATARYKILVDHQLKGHNADVQYNHIQI